MEERRWKLTELSRRKAMEQAWAVVKTLTGDWELVLRPFKSKRTDEQRRRQWALYRQVAEVVWLPDEDGNMRRFDAEVWHEQFAQWFVGYTEMPDGSKKALSTANMNVGDFSEYMTQIEAWCAEQGYQVMEAA